MRKIKEGFSEWETLQRVCVNTEWAYACTSEGIEIDTPQIDSQYLVDFTGIGFIKRESKPLRLVFNIPTRAIGISECAAKHQPYFSADAVVKLG